MCVCVCVCTAAGDYTNILVVGYSLYFYIYRVYSVYHYIRHEKFIDYNWVVLFDAIGLLDIDSPVAMIIYLCWSFMGCRLVVVVVVTRHFDGPNGWFYKMDLHGTRSINDSGRGARTWIEPTCRARTTCTRFLFERIRGGCPVCVCVCVCATGPACCWLDGSCALATSLAPSPE